MGRGVTWTKDEVAQLRMLHAEGRTNNYIALKLGTRGHAAVKSKLAGLGLSPNEQTIWTPERDATLTRLLGEHLSLVEIAEQLADDDWEPTPDAIKNRKDRLGITRDPEINRKIHVEACGKRAGKSAGIWTDERIEELRRLWAEGLSAAEIALRMRIKTRSAVIGKLHRLGLTATEATLAARRVTKAQRKAPKKFKATAKPTVHPFNKSDGARFAPMRRAPSILNAVAVDLSHVRPFVDREPGQCSWVCSDDDAPVMMACCAPTGGSRISYCPAHALIGTRRTQEVQVDRLIEKYAA